MSILSNIHKVAARIIPMQTITWQRLTYTTTAAYRQEKSITVIGQIKAHVQPGIISSFGGKNISEKDYKDLGLDFSRNYVTIWTSENDIRTVAYQQTADQVVISGKTYNIIQRANWLEYNGWSRYYCEEKIQ